MNGINPQGVPLIFFELLFKTFWWVARNLQKMIEIQQIISLTQNEVFLCSSIAVWAVENRQALRVIWDDHWTCMRAVNRQPWLPRGVLVETAHFLFRNTFCALTTLFCTHTQHICIRLCIFLIAAFWWRTQQSANNTSLHLLQCDTANLSRNPTLPAQPASKTLQNHSKTSQNRVHTVKFTWL